MNEKMVWAILDIEPTDDVDAIREAYRAKLVHTNPEDDQEGFMALKDAYDEAMRLAEAGNEEEAEELSPIMMKVDELYKDITRRQDIKEWDELLSAPEFSSIDEQDIVRNEILTYTLDNYKYSTEVWRKLDSVLTIVQDADTLRDQYPQGFIDFIVECILYGNYVLEDKVIAGRQNGVSEINNFAIDSDQTPLEISEFKCEVDEYVDLLSRIGREYGNIDNVKVSEENRLALIDRLGADILFARRYDYYHPFEEIAVIKYLYYKERYEECFKLLESAIDRTVMTGEEHSDFYYSHLVFMYLRFFVEAKHRDMGLSISPERLAKCKEAVPVSMEEIYVNETHAALSLISYLEGDKKEAADYMSFMGNFHRNSTVYSDFSKQIDSDRLEELPGLIEANPDNVSLKLSLAWIYSRTDRLEEAYDIVKNLETEGDTYMDYCFFMARYFMEKQDFNEAMPYLINWKDALCERHDPEVEYNLNDFPIKEVRNIRRIAFAYYMISVAYYNQDDLDSAKENVLKALKYSSEVDYYDYTGLYDSILLIRKEYDEGTDFWTNEVEKNNEYVVICRGYRQYMAYKADRAREVIDDYFYLRYNDPYYPDSYVRAEDVYLDYNDLEGFENCLEFVKQNEISDIRLDFNYARYLRAKKQSKEALEIFKNLESAIDEDDHIMEMKSRFYVSYGYCLMDIEREEEDFISHEDFTAKMLELIDKAENCEDENVNSYWLEVDYRERYDKDFDLKSLYYKMLELFPNNGAIDYELGLIFKKEDDYEKAGEYFESGIVKSPHHINLHYELSDYYNDYRYKKLEEIEYIDKAIEVARKLIDLRYDSETAVQYGITLYDGQEYEEALEFLNKAVEDFPDEPYVINARGLVLMRMDRFEEAEVEYRRAIDVFKGKGRFVGYTNIVTLYEKMNRFEDAATEYLNFMEKFDQHEISNYNRLADLYDRAALIDKAIEYRRQAIALKIQRIIGDDAELDLDFPLSINKIAEKYSSVPIERFTSLIDYMFDIAASYSLAGETDKMKEIEAENMSFVERVNLFRDLEDIPDGMREEFGCSIWSVGYFYTFTHRNAEMAAPYFEKYVEVRKVEKNMVRYYDSIFQAYDLLSRTYLFIGNEEKAAEAAKNAIDCIVKSHGSVENYINYKRYRPLYLCRLSGLYYAMGEKDKAFECLDLIDSSKKCTHCSYSYCVDKTDRIALYAELEGDYQKAIDFYEYGREHAGYETEKISGIRECKLKLQ